jgi:hypothetical protein
LKLRLEDGLAQGERRRTSDAVASGEATMTSHRCGGEKSRVAIKEQRRATKLHEEEKMDWTLSKGYDRG